MQDERVLDAIIPFKLSRIIGRPSIHTRKAPVRALLLPRGRGKDEFKERRKETRRTPNVPKKKGSPGRSSQSGRRRTKGGSSGRKDTATVRRYKTILFLPPSISLFSFSLGFYAAGILNRLDNVIRLFDVFSKDCLNITFSSTI